MVVYRTILYSKSGNLTNNSLLLALLPAQYGEQGLCSSVVSVRLSVPAWAHSGKPAAAGLLLWAWRAGDIDRLLHGRRSAAAVGECGQCHVVSIHSKLNTDLFLSSTIICQSAAIFNMN